MRRLIHVRAIHHVLLLGTALLLGTLPLSVSANELELLFYRAPQPLDWSTPGQLARSTFKNTRQKVEKHFWMNGARYVQDQSYPHPISHVNVKVQCAGRAPLYRGMTGLKSDFSYIRDFLVRRTGVDMILTSTPGRLYSNDEILEWLPDLRAQGYVRSLKLQLNSEQCEKVQDYLHNYETLQVDRIYGSLRSDPLLGQGAGCAAFAVSFLRVLGLLALDIENAWKRNLRVPLELVTTEKRPARYGMLGYLRGKDSRWAQPNEEQVDLRFYDPELMYNWVGEIVEGSRTFLEPLTYTVGAHPEDITLIWDVSQRVSPKGWPFFLPANQLASNVQYHIARADQLMTEDEVRNPLLRECQQFQLCDHKAFTVAGLAPLQATPNPLSATLTAAAKVTKVPSALKTTTAVRPKTKSPGKR